MLKKLCYTSKEIMNSIKVWRTKTKENFVLNTFERIHLYIECEMFIDDNEKLLSTQEFYFTQKKFLLSRNKEWAFVKDWNSMKNLCILNVDNFEILIPCENTFRRNITSSLITKIFLNSLLPPALEIWNSVIASNLKYFLVLWTGKDSQ